MGVTMGVKQLLLSDTTGDFWEITSEEVKKLTLPIGGDSYVEWLWFVLPKRVSRYEFKNRWPDKDQKIIKIYINTLIGMIKND